MASRLFAPASSERVDNSGSLRGSGPQTDESADNEPTKRRSSSLVGDLAASILGADVLAGPAVGTVVAPAATAPAVGTVVSTAAGPPVPTTVAPSPYNSSYPPTAGGVVQGYATPPPQAVGTTVAPPPYATAATPQAVQAEVVVAAPMDRK